MSLTKALVPWAGLLALGLGVSVASRAQEVAPAPSAEPRATMTPGPPGGAGLPCAPSPARGFFSRPQVPLPPELQGNVVLVKTGAVRVAGRPPSLKPWVVSDLRIGPMSGGGDSAGLDLEAFRVTFGFRSLVVQQDFSFRLSHEATPAAPGVLVRCRWGGASMTRELSTGGTGVEMKVPQGNATLCELFDEPDAEPWRLFLWVGPPSNLVPPEFPSGGGLVRGEVRYEAVSTNAIKPSLAGLKPTVTTGTFFRTEGRAVAAVERLVPGRVLMQCSVPAEEQALFVAVGAALFVRDTEAWTYDH